MMVKPEGADEGEAKPLEPPPVNTADDPEGEDAEAMDALLGVGSDLSGAAPAAPHRNGDTRADAAPPRALERVKSQEKNAPSRAHSPKGSPARCANPTSAFLLRPPTTPVRVPPTLPPPRLPRFAPILAPSLRSSSLVSPAAVPITSPRDPRSKPPKDPTPETADPNDMDESAKMLMLLGELGGHVEDSDEGDSDAGDDSGNDSQGGAAGKSDYPRNVSTPKRKNAKSNAGGSNAGAAEATAAGMNRVDANVSGPVGEWLRAEGEARMKMADHRRLIYRWTNAIYRLLGMKIPRGMGSLFDKGEKNKREKFDRFLSYYYGTETFEPGTYWYNNADTIQFFIELIRIATRNRYVPEPITIQKLFRKKDPTRQASTWIMVQEELDKTDVSAAELRSLFEGPPRVEGGFPRGRPLFVPIPKNPKGHHKYNKSGGEGGESVPNSPNPAPKKERRERGDATPRRGAARAPVAAAAATTSDADAALAAAAEAAARAHAAATANHTRALSQQAQAYAAHEAMLRTTAAAAAAMGLHMDPAAASALNTAHRQSSLAAALQGAVGLPIVPGTDFGAVAMAQAAAAAAAPGACEGVTLAPSPVGGGRGASRSGGGFKRQGSRLEGNHVVVRRLDEPIARITPPEIFSSPTRVVGEILLATLADVTRDHFGMRVAFAEDDESEPAAAAAAGRERLMNLPEEVAKHLPVVSTLHETSGDGGGGRATREPAVDRTALTAEVDSVMVAARAADATWKRHVEAQMRAAESAAKHRRAEARRDAAMAELAGARLAREAADGPAATEADRGLGDAMRAAIDGKIAATSRTAESLEAEAEAAAKIEAEAKAQAVTSGRAFRPPYEEVRKRTLRLRLAAEERAERQIGRALSRAERDATGKRAKAKKAEGEEAVEATRRADEAEAGVAKLKAAAEGCKTAVEWSKRAIALIASGRDV